MPNLDGNEHYTYIPHTSIHDELTTLRYSHRNCQIMRITLKLITTRIINTNGYLLTLLVLFEKT